MHGLRCTPALVGWTRLLDEWVVGLTAFNRAAPDEPTCWEIEDQARDTLWSAVRRVVSFAFPEAEAQSVVVDAAGTACFELQGRQYRVAIGQAHPEESGWLRASARDALRALFDRANQSARGDEVPVGALLVTPELAADRDVDRVELARSFIEESRTVNASGCAYSFPRADETDRYRYVSERCPGVLLFVHAPAISA